MKQKTSTAYLDREILQRRELTNFRLTEVAHPPGHRLPKHSHERAHFLTILDGSYAEDFGAETLEYEPLSTVFLPADETHSDQVHGGGARSFVIEFEPQWLTGWLGQAIPLDKRICFRGGSLPWLALRLYQEFRAMDKQSPLAIEGLALEMVAEASRQISRNPYRRPPLWLQQARGLLHEQFSVDLDLAAIASAVGVHPAHLSRAFRQFYRCTMGQYVRELRLGFARHKLSHSDTPLVEIAAAAGFCDQSHFSKVFKRMTGLTPAQFRAHARPKRG